jgi:hypothetical protein
MGFQVERRGREARSEEVRRRSHLAGGLSTNTGHGGCLGGHGVWRERLPVAHPVTVPVKTITVCYTVKKVSDFPVPAGMSLTKLSLAGNLNFSRPGRVW